MHQPHHRFPRLARATLAALLALAGLAQSAAAQAPTPAAPRAPQGCSTLVKFSADGGPNTLRDAVGCAAAGQIITFDPILTGADLPLVNGVITITQPILIDGSGAPGVSVSGINAHRVFIITASGTVTLTNLGLEFGLAADSAGGGALLASSDTRLVLDGVRVHDNAASTGSGGGLYSSGALVMTDTTFVDNSSSLSAGGAYVSGTVTLSGGSFEHNACSDINCSGGGLFANQGMAVTGTTFISNTSQVMGGGAWANNASQITNGLFRNNRCTITHCNGGGLDAYQDLAVTGTQFISNTSLGNGGGLYSPSPVSITTSRFEDNHCTDAFCGGAGLAAPSVVTLTDSDFISNTSPLGGLAAGAALGWATVTNGSFVGNQCTGSNCFGGGLSTLHALTLTGTSFVSNTSGFLGGGLVTGAAASVSHAHFQGNQCLTAGCWGGALLAGGPLTVTNTDFISNTSLGNGGGLSAQVSAFVADSRFQGNRCTGPACKGGGLNAAATLILTGTDFISNTSLGGTGGGLTVAGALTVTNSGFISNTSLDNGGGVLALSTAVLIDSRFQSNQCTGPGCLGGGLALSGDAQVLNSALSGNQAAGSGGAVAITGTAQVVLANVTLGANRATQSGGGLFAGAASHAGLWNVSIADNQAPSGAGLQTQPGAGASLTNTLLANNGAANCSGTLAAGTHNLEWPAATCAASVSAGFASADPLLAPLALNAPGASLTYALLRDSPARDQGDPASCAGPLVNNRDQRGVTRPINGDTVPGAICDIGAFEAGPPVWALFLPLLRK